MDQQIEQILQVILESVPPDILLAFLQILSQMQPEEIAQLAQMVGQAVQQQQGAQQQGSPQQQQMQQQGDANLYGGGY